MNSVFKKINRRLSPGHLYYSPEWLVLGVNNICNLHCKMCDVGTGYTESNFYYHLMGAHPVNMPLELIKNIIDQTALYFPKTKLGYAFTEPMIYPHLAESIEYASSKDLFTSVTSNGLTLEKKADDLVKAGLKELYISLDGPPDVHNFIRGHKQSFQSALTGIEKFMGTNSSLPFQGGVSEGRGGYVPSVSIYCAITQWSTGRLAEFLDLFKHLPIKEIGFMHTNYTSPQNVEKHNKLYGEKYKAEVSCLEELDLSKMNLDELHNEITEINNRSYSFKIIFSPNITAREQLQTFYFEPEKFIGKTCNDSFRNVMIKSDGTVIPSHGRCYKVTAGNIYNDNLKEIWNSKVLSQFRKDLLRAGGLFPACSRCCSAF